MGDPQGDEEMLNWVPSHLPLTCTFKNIQVITISSIAAHHLFSFRVINCLFTHIVSSD